MFLLHLAAQNNKHAHARLWGRAAAAWRRESSKHQIESARDRQSPPL